MIVVYAQWVGLNKQPFTEQAKQWFDRIHSTTFWLYENIKYDKPYPVSELMKSWIFANVREFPMPYVKRTYLTNSKTLSQDKWTEWVCDRVDLIQDTDNNCKLSVQIQNFGGEDSQFRKLGSGDCPTSHSWRSDTNVVCVLDCFYDSFDGKNQAEQWQTENDRIFVGSQSAKFCSQDRRVWWGSYSSPVHDNSWDKYYEKRIYDRVLATKKALDPNGVFTPNMYTVDKLPQPGSVEARPNLSKRALRPPSERGFHAPFETDLMLAKNPIGHKMLDLRDGRLRGRDLGLRSRL